MRSLFALLVLGNIVLAGWYALRPAPPAAASSRVLGVPGIELVGERLNDARRATSSWVDNGAWGRRDVATTRAGRPADDSTAAALEPSATAAASRSASCTSIGPFRDDAAAEQAAQRLAAAGHALSKRSAEEDFWIGYWVYIEKLDSAAQARDVAARMRDGGIDDAYVVSDEDLGTLVSLGVFSGERRANRQRDTARSLGSEPTVVERTRRAVATWLDVTSAGAPSIDLQTLQPAESSTPLRQEACVDPLSP